MALARYMASNYVRRVLVSLGAAVVAFALVFGYFLVRYESLERRFRQIHPDDSEEQLIEVVGAPTSIRGCGEGVHSLPTDGGSGTSRCARVYWYSAYRAPSASVAARPNQWLRRSHSYLTEMVSRRYHET
jgi:hypothetical protein